MQPLGSEGDLRTGLKSKARARRETLSGLAAASLGNSTLRNDLLPRLDFVTLSTAALKAPARNVRKLDPVHVRDVANAIQTLGFCDPPLIDGDNNILDGLVRVEAAKLLNLPEIPCIRADHLTANEKRLLRLALNRLSEKGGWQLDELKLELTELLDAGITIETTGFTVAELDHILIGDEIAPIEQGPLVPSSDPMAISQVGDIFVLGNHRIICGDATKPEVYVRLMGDRQARLLLTDQPYNVPISGHVTKGQHREFVMASGEMSDAEFASFNRAWIGAAKPYLGDGALFGTFIDWRGYPVVQSAAADLGFTLLNLIVWAKTNAGLGSLYRSQHELLPLYKKDQAPHVNNVELGKSGRWRSNVWSYPGASSLGSDSRSGLQLHPTVKPTAMLEDALLDVTKRDEIVLDPFLGSGSTLIAAEKTRRTCYGIELDPRYVDTALRRFEAIYQRQAVLEQTGETFAELCRNRNGSLETDASV